MQKTSLQLFLENKFVSWTPLKPEVINKSYRDVTLKWDPENEPFGVLSDHFLYKISVKDKVPPWRIIYSGGKTSIKINDLASGFFHKFRLQVILKAESVSDLANEFLKHYSDKQSIYEIFNKTNTDNIDGLTVSDGNVITQKDLQTDTVINNDIEKGETIKDTNKEFFKEPIRTQSGYSKFCKINPDKIDVADDMDAIIGKHLAIDTNTNTGIINFDIERGKIITETDTNKEICKEPNRIKSGNEIFSKINPDKIRQNVSNDKDATIGKNLVIDTNTNTSIKKDDTSRDTNNEIEEPNKRQNDDVKIQINLTTDMTAEPVLNESGDFNLGVNYEICNSSSKRRYWLESLWSEEVWVTTDTEGTSAACFCMAVQCGYLKQVQQNVEEKPELVNTLNATNGRTPLIIAVTKGNVPMVTLLISCGADVNQKCTAGRTALHLAIYHHHLTIAQILLERGANIEECDVNGLRWEHLAVDSCTVEALQFVLENGGDVEARDSHGWTPLFRAVCQGSSDEMIRCLCDHGADINVRDYSGLPLQSIALLLTDKRGSPREAVLRLVDANYPRELARGHFTRLTRKINRILKATTLV